MVSTVNQQTFFDLLSRLKSGSSEEVFQFPLEYYVGESIIFIYKTVMSKTYKTIVNVIPKAVEVGMEMRMDVLINGDLVSLEEFIKDLRVNHNGVELIEPMDYDKIIIKHNHNMHEHAGSGFNDVLY